MTLGKRRVRVTALFLVTAATLMALAATASAQTRAGETTTVSTVQSPTPGATILKATASYETSGSATFNITTAGLPDPESEGEIWAALTTTSSCASATEAFKSLEEGLIGSAPAPVVITSKLTVAGAQGVKGSLFAVERVNAAKSVAGTTVTLTATGSNLANEEFNCAYIAASDGEGLSVPEGEALGTTFVGIPLVAQAEPPPPASSGDGSSSGSGSVSQAPPPAAAPPAPPALSIGKLKPLALKAGKWQSVKVTVTNTGAGASAAGSLRLKGPKGVVARPERQQLPALAPGRSFTLTFRVELTAKAKKRSTVALTATASGLSAPGSLLVKLKE